MITSTVCEYYENGMKLSEWEDMCAMCMYRWSENPSLKYQSARHFIDSISDAIKSINFRRNWSFRARYFEDFAQMGLN